MMCNTDEQMIKIGLLNIRSLSSKLFHITI